MNFLTLGALALALGADAFSLSVGVGVTGIRLRRMIGMAVIIGLFHVLFPLAGIWAGNLLGGVAGEWAGRIGAAVLLFIGGRMVYESLKASGQRAPLGQGRGLLAEPAKRPRSMAVEEKKPMAEGLWPLLALSAGVSLDALGVGFSLGTMQFNIPVAVLTLGVVAALMTFLGLQIGKGLGRVIGDKAELAGGVILLLIGFKLLAF